MSMINELLSYYRMINDALKKENRQALKSLSIDYHPPFVQRIYFDIGDKRMNLHRMHPCSPEDALMHPHPWPSAVSVLSGSYEMSVGFSEDETEPKDTMKFILSKGSHYEMENVNSWHSVAPIVYPSLSVMLTGKPNDRPIKVKPQNKLRELTDDEFYSLINDFREVFRLTNKELSVIY